MRADDRAQRLDHQRVGDRLQLAANSLGVRLRAGVADDNADAMAAVDSLCELDYAVQRAVESPYTLERRHDAVTQAEHRLDLQDRAEHRARETDAAAAAEEFERCNRKIGLHLGSHRLDLRDDGLRLRAL